MPKQPIQTLVPAELTKFGVPSMIQLQQSNVVSATISRIVLQDEAVTAYHRTMVRAGVCFRYEFALAVAADKKAFAAYQQDKRIKALARPPTSPADVLRSLFNATYGDPKKASKYFKRVEPFWDKRSPVKAVETFLEKKGLSDPPLKALPAPSSGAGGEETPDVERDKPGNGDAAGNGGRNGKSSRIAAMPEPPAGMVTIWPGKARVGRNYRLFVKVYAYDGETAFIELIEDPEQLK